MIGVNMIFIVGGGGGCYHAGTDDIYMTRVV